MNLNHLYQRLTKASDLLKVQDFILNYKMVHKGKLIHCLRSLPAIRAKDVPTVEANQAQGKGHPRVLNRPQGCVFLPFYCGSNLR